MSSLPAMIHHSQKQETPEKAWTRYQMLWRSSQSFSNILPRMKKGNHHQPASLAPNREQGPD